MKKIAFSVLVTLISLVSYSQFSFKEMNSLLASEGKNESSRNTSEGYNPGKFLDAKKITNEFRQEIKVLDSTYNQKRLNIIKSDTTNKEEKIKSINNELDTLISHKLKLIGLVEYWDKYYKHGNGKQKTFFPAYYSLQSMAFFDGDSVHKRLFQNNLINYSPKNKKMILYTELINDYLGPVRIGIGFQVKSESSKDSLSTVDSIQKLDKKTDLLSSLQNGSGDISVNIRLPFVRNKNENTLIQHKFYLYANSGFSLPILSKATSDFIFAYNIGIEGALYARGFNNKLTFFTQLKAGYYDGNNNYKKIIIEANKNDPSSFFMLQSSIGFDFMDGYRFRVDIYNGNSFIKKNFPATLTFIVRPTNN